MSKNELFIGLIKQHEGLIFKIARAYATDRDDQKDLYQEIVFQLWKSFDTFRSEAKITTWMYRVALNTSLSYSTRTHRRIQVTSLDFDIMDEVNESMDSRHDKLSLLYRKVKELNAIDKAIVLLFLEGRSHQEISDITGISKTNVGTKLSRIKIKLKNKILNAPS